MSTARERVWFAAVASISDCVLCGSPAEQVSHSNMARGLGQKSQAWLTARLCAGCHHEIDNGSRLSQLQRRELHWRAVALTHAILVERGQLGLI